MSASVDAEVEVSLAEAESRGSCLTAHSEVAHRILERRRKKGELVMPARGLYARVSYWDGLDAPARYLHLLRGLARAHANWTFCGVSAGMLHGLSVSYHLLDKVEIVNAAGSRQYYGGLVVGRKVVDDKPDYDHAAHVSYTSLSRTLFDCARTMEFADAVACIDSALRSGKASKPMLERYFEGKKRFRGKASALEAIRFADARSGSGGESIARARMWQLGFAAPDLQREVVDPLDGKKYYVDFCWDIPGELPIFGEFDGRRKYEDPQMNHGGALGKLREERIRESRISGRAQAVVRFTSDDVRDLGRLDALLSSFNVPKDHEPLLETVPRAAGDWVGLVPDSEEVPLEAYWY